MDALTQYDIRSLEFRNIVRPFFTIHTEHFAHELLNFAQTNFDLVGYDQSVTYLPRGLYLFHLDAYSTTLGNCFCSTRIDICLLQVCRTNTHLASYRPRRPAALLALVSALVLVATVAFPLITRTYEYLTKRWT